MTVAQQMKNMYETVTDQLYTNACVYARKHDVVKVDITDYEVFTNVYKEYPHLSLHYSLEEVVKHLNKIRTCRAFLHNRYEEAFYPNDIEDDKYIELVFVETLD